MKKGLLFLISVFLLNSLSLSQEKEFKITVIKKSVKEVIEEAKKAEKEEKKEKWKKEISLLEPRNAEDVDTLLGCVENNKNYRFACRFALEKLGYEQREFAPLFMERLKSRNPDVKISAIKGVSRFKYKESVPELIKIVKTSKIKKIKEVFEAQNERIVWESTLALGNIGDERAIPVLLKRLKEGSRDNDPFETVTVALQTMGKASGLGKKLLITVMEEVKKTDDKELIKKYSHIVGAINDKESVPILLEIVKDEKIEEIIRNSAVGAWAIIIARESVDKLIETYKIEKDDRIKSSIRYALEKTKNKKAIPIFLEALKDKNSITRASAAYSLGEICNQSDKIVIPALEEALNDHDRETRILAGRALKKITGKDYKAKGIE